MKANEKFLALCLFCLMATAIYGVVHTIITNSGVGLIATAISFAAMLRFASKEEGR